MVIKQILIECAYNMYNFKTTYLELDNDLVRLSFISC